MRPEIALTHEICPICHTQTNSVIVLPKKITEKTNKDIKEVHNKIIGFSEPCDKCNNYLNDGYVALIGIDPEKSNPTPKNLTEFHYTGSLIWIKEDVFSDVFKDKEGLIEGKFALVEEEIMNVISKVSEEE